MVKLTRRVRFSSGHRYWLESLTPDQNRETFGGLASPYSHGHNYILDVTIAGELGTDHGMVINIKRLDDLLQERVVQVFDQRSINDEVEHFRKVAPCLENLLIYFYEVLFHSQATAEIDGTQIQVCGLRLEEKFDLWANLNPTTNAMTLTRTYEFAASHRLHLPDMSDAENYELFGKCNNPAGHGHNYILEVTVEGKPYPQTGLTVDLDAMDKFVESTVVDRYDHKNLSVDLPEFAGKNATSEIVVEEIFRRLAGPMATDLDIKLRRVRLHETERNIFEVEAS